MNINILFIISIGRFLDMSFFHVMFESDIKLVTIPNIIATVLFYDRVEMKSELPVIAPHI